MRRSQRTEECPMSNDQGPRNAQFPMTNPHCQAYGHSGLGHSLGLGHWTLDLTERHWLTDVTQTRRHFFRRTGLGFGAAALAALLHDDTATASSDPLASRKPQF